MSLALGGVGRLMTRYLHQAIAAAPSWDEKFPLSDESINELKFWATNLRKLNGKTIISQNKTELMVFSDASASGGGSILRIAGKKEVCVCNWTEDERDRSSTWRELKAMQHGLQSLGPRFLVSKCVKWHSDNKALTRIVEVGSMKKDLQEIALSIYSICAQLNIKLETTWVPRELNAEADESSRLIDWDDWAISKEVFSYLNSLWGPFTIDGFANAENAQISRFFSRFWVPGSAGVDAFAFDWSVENAWLVPPVHLIPRTLFHIMHCNASATLLVPKWPSSIFWPLICGDAYFARNISDLRELRNAADFLRAGTQKHSIFSPEKFKGSFLALRFLSTRSL